MKVKDLNRGTAEVEVIHITEDLLHVAYVPQTKRMNVKCPKALIP